jgi:small subunit ribosomal protein S1
VISVSGDTVVVDIGRKIEGALPADQLKDAAGNLTVKPGDKLDVSITGRGEEGYYLLSKAVVERPKDWSSLQKAFDEHQTIAGTVSGAIKGGLTVDIGVRAFLPASRSGIKDNVELEKLVGQEIRCKIIKLDVDDEDVVVDRRVILEEEEAKVRADFVSALEPGQVVNGTVRTLTDYGAFVELTEGIDGLLHVADMAWTRVGKPSDLLSAGDSVQVKILKIDREAKRISLGMKQLVPDPWSVAAEKYTSGERVQGTVKKLADFGAFVELEPGVEGLIPMSEMTWSKRARKPSDVLKAGEVVDVMILNVNAGERRISLGLKQALGDPWDDADKRFPAGAIIEGPITNIAKFGAFVELSDGLEGMVHIADIDAEKHIKHPQDVLKIGQRIKAVILEVDIAKKRIRLGMKQLQPTTADEYIAEHKAGDVVTGRLVEVQGAGGKAELGEGVVAPYRIPRKEAPEGEDQAKTSAADLGSLTAMLSAKWKQGKAPRGSTADPLRAGQIRSFRIVSLDPAKKSIELELA